MDGNRTCMCAISHALAGLQFSPALQVSMNRIISWNFGRRYQSKSIAVRALIRVKFPCSFGKLLSAQHVLCIVCVCEE